jgi:hypothetical protein
VTQTIDSRRDWRPTVADDSRRVEISLTLLAVAQCSAEAVVAVRKSRACDESPRGAP